MLMGGMIVLDAIIKSVKGNSQTSFIIRFISGAYNWIYKHSFKNVGCFHISSSYVYHRCYIREFRKHKVRVDKIKKGDFAQMLEYLKGNYQRGD